MIAYCVHSLQAKQVRQQISRREGFVSLTSVSPVHFNLDCDAWLESVQLHNHLNTFVVSLIKDLYPSTWWSITSANKIPWSAMMALWEILFGDMYMPLMDGFSEVYFYSLHDRWWVQYRSRSFLHSRNQSERAPRIGIASKLAIQGSHKHCRHNNGQGRKHNHCSLELVETVET